MSRAMHVCGSKAHTIHPHHHNAKNGVYSHELTTCPLQCSELTYIRLPSTEATTTGEDNMSNYERAESLAGGVGEDCYISESVALQAAQVHASLAAADAIRDLIEVTKAVAGVAPRGDMSTRTAEAVKAAMTAAQYKPHDILEGR